MTTRHALAIILGAALAACAGVHSEGSDDIPLPEGRGRGAGGESGSEAPGSGSGPGGSPAADDFFSNLPHGKAQLDIVCKRGGTNVLTRAFCSAQPPALGGLADLQRAVGLDFKSTATGRLNNGRNGNPGFALTGHSSSLVARFVNAINPRAIVFTPPSALGEDFVALGFARGEQVVEIAAREPETGDLRFFLVVFEQACNKGGCTSGDLLTPAVEKDWTGATIYEDLDLANTVFDCTQCHQPEGAGTPKMLRFQELRNPWTHWFRDASNGGRALLADFHAAHGDSEDYGPIPAAQIDSSEPQQLENFVRGAGFGFQPNEFPTLRIESEVRRSSPGQPADNSTPGTSGTWDGLYDAFLEGRVIAPPYHDVKVTDPQKLESKAKGYRAFIDGAAPASSVPDVRDTFLDESAWRMGFAPKPGISGEQILVSMCSSCHNGNVDKSLSRARFDATSLDAMSRGEKDKAIARMRLPAGSQQKMPPVRFRTLTGAEIDLAASVLAQ